MKDNVRRKFGEKVRKLRAKWDYTQERLADLTGIDYKYIQRIESKNPPAVKIDTIKRIASALKVAPSELLE